MRVALKLELTTISLLALLSSAAVDNSTVYSRTYTSYWWIGGETNFYEQNVTSFAPCDDFYSWSLNNVRQVMCQNAEGSNFLYADAYTNVVNVSLVRAGGYSNMTCVAESASFELLEPIIVDIFKGLEVGSSSEIASGVVGFCDVFAEATASHRMLRH